MSEQTTASPKEIVALDETAWDQLVQLDEPQNTPVAQSAIGIAPIQTWEEQNQVLPDIGDVDNKILAAGGLSNTILISTTTEEVLAQITVRVGANGNWWVGTTDTGIEASGTDSKQLLRPAGTYIVPTQSWDNVTRDLTISAGGAFCIQQTGTTNIWQIITTESVIVNVDPATSVLCMDYLGNMVELTDATDPRVGTTLAPIAYWDVSGTGDYRPAKSVPELLYNLVSFDAYTEDLLAQLRAEADSLKADMTAHAAALTAQFDTDASNTADAELARIQSTTDTQVARVTTEGDTQVARVQTEGGAQVAAATTQAQNAAASATSAANDAATATTQANIATSEAAKATTEAGKAKTEADRAKTYADLLSQAVLDKGEWDASTGNFPAPSMTPETADMYRIKIGGTMTNADPNQPDVTVREGALLFWNVQHDYWYDINNVDVQHLLDLIALKADDNVTTKLTAFNGATILPAGTTAERPDKAQLQANQAYIRGNTDLGEFEGIIVGQTEWGSIGGGGLTRPTKPDASEYPYTLKKGQNLKVDLSDGVSKVVIFPTGQQSGFGGTISATGWNGDPAVTVTLTVDAAQEWDIPEYPTGAHLVLRGNQAAEVQLTSDNKLAFGYVNGENQRVVKSYPTEWQDASSLLAAGIEVFPDGNFLYRWTDKNTIHLAGIVRKTSGNFVGTEEILTLPTNTLTPGKFQYRPSVSSNDSLAYVALAQNGAAVAVNRATTSQWVMMDAMFYVEAE